MSGDLDVTFGMVSLTQVTPRLLEDWAGLPMTFEFLTSSKCHFSAHSAWTNTENILTAAPRRWAEPLRCYLDGTGLAY